MLQKRKRNVAEISCSGCSGGKNIDLQIYFCNCYRHRSSQSCSAELEWRDCLSPQNQIVGDQEMLKSFNYTLILSHFLFPLFDPSQLTAPPGHQTCSGPGWGLFQLTTSEIDIASHCTTQWTIIYQRLIIHLQNRFFLKRKEGLQCVGWRGKLLEFDL